MKSVMKHNFSVTPTIDAPRSKFDRSHGYKTVMDSNWLVPFYWDSVLPGDTFHMRSTILARLSTPLFPVMDNMYLDTQFFFVPNRILWDNWRKFCGEQTDPGDSIDYQIPILEGTLASDADSVLTTDAGRKQALMNYLGVPDGLVPDDQDISALPFRAYMRIYNEWYRDQNLIDSYDAGLLTDDGPDDIDTAAEGHILCRRGKRHDYFSSCLPWPQKGDAVTLPLGSTAPVVGIGQTDQVFSASPGTVYESDGGTDTYTFATQVNTKTFVKGLAASGSYPQIFADLSSATASTVNDLREAFQVQKLLERDARAGTRYNEIIRNHFNVEFMDVTYRPEFLGGGSQSININPVAATSDNTVGSNTEVGDLGAFGISTGSNHSFSKSFVEHGIVMGIMSVRADLTYQQGLDRHFSHSTRYDIYWPSLAHLGEQAVLTKEIFADGTATDETVFGYQERYAEYRYKPSRITRLFQSAATSSLDPWHLSQEFSAAPVLNQLFIEEDTPIDRVVATAGEPHFIVDIYNNLICARPMPVFGVPGMIDHF